MIVPAGAPSQEHRLYGDTPHVPVYREHKPAFTVGAVHQPREYLRGWSPGTIGIYRRALAAFSDTPLNKAALASWVVALREHGHSIGGVNVLTRAISSYLSWLHEEGHTREHLRIKQIPNPPRAIKTFSNAEVRRIVLHRPRRKAQVRTWTLMVLLLDTGLRISEALGLERRHIDLDGRILDVLGKGHREVVGA